MSGSALAQPTKEKGDSTNPGESREPKAEAAPSQEKTENGIAVAPTPGPANAVAGKAGDVSSGSPAPSSPDSQLGPRRAWSTRRHQTQQSVALTLLATLAVLYALSAAQAIMFPIVLALLFSLTLRPVVRTLERRGINRLITSIGLLAVTVTVTVAGIISVVEPAETWMREAPDRMQVVGHKLSGVRDRINEIYSVSERIGSLAAGNGEVSDEVPQKVDGWRGVWDRAVAAVTTPESARPASGEQAPEPIAVEVRQPKLLSGLAILNSAGNALAMVVITLALGFFLLLEGDILLNNVLSVVPKFSDKKSVVRLVHNVEQGISKYLLTVTVINVLLGIAEGTAMWLLGVPNPALWGLMATILNYIPFLGALVGTVVMFLVAVFAFDSVAYASLVPLVYFTLTLIEGNFITPSFVGRAVSLNAVAVFTSLVVWGWLWGVGGALIGVPLLIIFKLVCDQFEKTAAIGALLEGRRELT